MNKNDFKDVETDGIDNNTAVTTEESSEKKKGFPRTKNRFEFALFLNEVLICKRSFPIDGYVEKSMYQSSSQKLTKWLSLLMKT